MSLDELQSWLVGEGIRGDLDEISRRMVITELDNLSPNSEPAPPIDWQRLLLAGSILARSDGRPLQEAALRIATGAITLSESKAVRDAGAVLLGKLSNFRAISLAGDRQLLTEGLDARLGISLRIEAQRRLLDRSVLVEHSGQWLQVNDFQLGFWDSASKNRWLSASAPTASGKTFLVLQWLLDQMRSGKERIAVYLAPSRALVSELESNLGRLTGKDSGVEVSSLPLQDKYNEARAAGSKLIFVFTQERLHLLINALNDAIKVDLLIVDEAHKIGDNQRGVILQDAIERISRANSDLKVVFISPATQNPGELLSDAPADASSAAVDSDVPTVLQNVIVAEQVPWKPKQWNLSLRQHSSNLPLGVLQLASSPDGVQKRLAFVAAAAGERGGTLVYANGAADSENIADLISQLIPAPDSVDRELSDLADLARKGVHLQYRLAALVERGVAFHYGNMPSLIRAEIERLFREGKIRFLVCTSTLIEGVNLSCRTIVLRGPRRGKGHPMEPHDFWNLAGRAGRWGDEFQGNIICIDTHDQKAWPIGVPSRARHPIKRESDAVIEQTDGLLDYLERRATTSLSELNDTDEYEQVGAYLLATFLRLGTIARSSLIERHGSDTVEKIDQRLAMLAGHIEIKPEIAARHPGVSALGMQHLLEAFRGYEKAIENLLPASISSPDSYDRLVTIMQRINKYLFPAFSPDGSTKYYALVVVQWLKGYSLAAMIRSRIDHNKHQGRSYKLPALIRSTMEDVEQIARFRAPKYLSAYIDILRIHLQAIGKQDLIEHDVDVGTQLEFGVSSRSLLSLMELGLSRMGAVSLYEKMARDDLSKEECLTWVAERDALLEGMDIPAIVVREIRDKLVRAR